MKDWSINYYFNLKRGISSSEAELAIYLKKEQELSFDGERKQAEKLFFYYILNSLPTALERIEIRELQHNMAGE